MRLLTLYHLHEKITECEMDQQKDITIGREKECSITIDDSLISRKHVRIFWENETWNVQCLSRFTQLKIGDGEMLSNLTVSEDTDCEFWMANYRIHISSPLNQEMQQPEVVPHVPPSTSTALLDPKDLDANESQDQLDTSLENHLENFSSDEAVDEIADEVENQNENTSLMNIENEPPGQLEEQDHEKTQFADQGLHSSNLEARLRVIKKGGIEDVFVLKGDRWVIGRGEDCEVFLDHPKVSRLHFELNCIQGEYYVKDLKSSNGTYLNGQKVSHLQAELLQSGDRINIEDVIICFEICNVELEKQLQVIATNQEDPIQSMQGVNQQSVHLPSEISPQPPQGAIRIPSPIKSRKKGNGKKKLSLIHI